jgi:hypothetical protein
MRKTLASLAILVAMVIIFTSSAFAASPGKIIEAPDLKIVVDGKTVVCKNVPIILNDSTLLPLRELAVMLGVQNDDQHIIYEPSNKSVTILKDNTKIVVYIGKLNAYVNDEPRTLAAIPVIYKKDITYIPFKFVAEALGKKVIWDGPSKTILLCDAVKFDNVKGIMDKVAAEFKKVSKYKTDMSISLDMKSGMVSTKMGINANVAVDNADKKMHMLMDMDMLGMKITTETYYADNASYTQNPLDGTWEKKVLLQPEYDKAFASESSSIIFKSDDTFCAGLDQVESANANEILLKGQLISSTLYEELLSQQDLGGEDSVIDNSDFDSFEVEISIDKNTYLVNSIVMSMKSNYSGEDDVETAMSMTAEAAYSDYNGAFEVVVPDDVKNNATETKVPTQLK